MRHVIIGTGAAGTAAARTIREIDPGADVTLIGEERFPPYNRFLLTDFLCDTVGEPQLFHTSEVPLPELAVNLRKGERVERVDTAARQVQLEFGDVLPYDRLLVATGRRPVLSEMLRPHSEHISGYYTLEDFLLLKERLPKIRRAVVCGQAVSTLNLLSGLCQLGKEVSYVIRGPRVDIPIVSATVDGDLDAAICDKGIDIIREDRIVSVRRDGEQYVAETYQGLELPADAVFAFDSYRPNLGCIRGTSVEINKGILVDLELRTSVEDIFGAGDCVEIYHPKLRNYWINFGWPNAVQQGKIAGANMAGKHETYQIADTIAFDILGKPFRARWWE